MCSEETVLVTSQKSISIALRIASDYRWTFLAGGSVGKLIRVALYMVPYASGSSEGRGVIANLAGLSSAAESATRVRVILYVSSNAVSLIFQFRN
jgi:hypothetical protein